MNTPPQGMYLTYACGSCGIIVNEMLDSIDSEIARQIRYCIEQITPIQRLVVYGSRARGDYAQDSDLDIFIEVPGLLTNKLRREISEVAWEIGLKNDRVISTFVATTQSIQSGAVGANPILHAIDLEGIPV